MPTGTVVEGTSIIVHAHTLRVDRSISFVGLHIREDGHIPGTRIKLGLLLLAGCVVDPAGQANAHISVHQWEHEPLQIVSP